MQAVHEGTRSAVNDGWVEGGAFFGSIAAGTLLGWGLDVWLDTDPWFIVTGIVAGSVAGFYRMWDGLKRSGARGKQDIFS